MNRSLPLLVLLLAAVACGSRKPVVMTDLPPRPSERVTPPPPTEPAPPPEVAPDPPVGNAPDPRPAAAPAPSGVDQDLVRAWQRAREPGVEFQQTMSMKTGAQGERRLTSRVRVLGDRSRRDDLGEDGGVVQTTLTLPDDVLVVNHATRTWTSVGGRLDQLAKDASSWYFQSDFRGLQRWTKVGEEVVDGILCDAYELGVSGADGKVRRTEKAWFARDLDGFALRYESSSFLGLGVTVVRTEVRKAPVSAQDLAVPAGYSRRAPGS